MKETGYENDAYFPGVIPMYNQDLLSEISKI